MLAAVNMGYLARLTRSSMLETLRQDYIRTAHAKGLPQRQVVGVHALRNALLPIVTVIGPALAFLVTGSFVVESLFAIPGVGFLGVQAIAQRDYPGHPGHDGDAGGGGGADEPRDGHPVHGARPTHQGGRLMASADDATRPGRLARPRAALQRRRGFWRRFARNRLAVVSLVVAAW